MRRLLTFCVLLSALAAVLVALPTITTTAGAAPRPVTAALEQVPLTGVDRTALADLRTSALRLAGTTPTSPTPTLLSAPLTGKRFSLLGVTWAPDPTVTDVDVQVRHRRSSGTRTGRWSAWEHVDAEGDDVPDAGSQDTRGALRAGSSPIWTGPSDAVQVRVDAGTGGRPRQVKVELIDPGTSPADVLPQAPRDSAGASEPRPEIVSRAQWGADESIRRGTPGYTSTVKVGFVHHTASSNDYTPEQAAAMVRGIYAYHVKSNGWSDIGYNFLVDRYGRAYEGRAGGMDRYVLGAHTGGFNVSSFGVSLLGDFSTVPPATPTVGMLSKVLAWKLGSAYRDPLGEAVLTSAGGGTSKYSAGTKVTFDVVSGHRDAGNTSCPGATTYARLPQIRQLVSEELGAGFVSPVATGGRAFALRATGPATVRAGTLGDLAWTGTVTTATGAVLKSASGVGGTAELTWDLTGPDGTPARPGSYLLKLIGSIGEDPALPYTEAVVVESAACRGAPLARARCKATVRSATG